MDKQADMNFYVAHMKLYYVHMSCEDPGSFVRGGPTLTTFVLVDEGREDPNTTMSGPLNIRCWLDTVAL